MQTLCAVMPMADQLAHSAVVCLPFIVVGALAYGFDVLVDWARRHGAERETILMLRTSGAVVLGAHLAVYLVPVLAHTVVTIRCWWQ